MKNRVCFLFGHATTPHYALELIEAAAESQYQHQGVRTFVVGNRGSFDRYAAAAIKSLKKQHTDISLLLLLAYHPSDRPVDVTDGFDNSYYPPIEGIPRRYAIVSANKYVVDTADSIICYVKHGGNARNLLAYAQQRQKKDAITITNVAENAYY